MVLWILGTERIGQGPAHRTETLRLQVSADPPRLLRTLQSGNPDRLVVRWGAVIGDEVRAEQVRAEAMRRLGDNGRATYVRGGWMASAEAEVIAACEGAAAALGVAVRPLPEIGAQDAVRGAREEGSGGGE